MNNRLEINGLKAIAVVAVILYHAQISILGHQPFKGGFIGVDIFFVISGYLITSIILKELVTINSFSFHHFYERRIRRIVPMLLCVSVLTIPTAWVYLLPDKLIYYSKLIITSIAFSSNFYVHYSGNTLGESSYFSNPFLHTWSLSVLVQFYILFPIFLLVTFKYFRNHLLTILVIGLLVSLLTADLGSRNYPSLNFYILPTRTWELLAGSILAYFEINNGHRSKNKILNLILPSVGVFLIGHSILFFNNKMFHPSFYTLSPIIGVCLFIWFANKDELITKILSTKLFVGIGLISYSLYLWHYPIFAFAKITEFSQGSLSSKVLLGIIILALSIFSYYFIEQPARNENNKFKVITSLSLVLIFVLIIININIVKNDGYKDRLSYIFKIDLSENTWRSFREKNTLCYVNSEICEFNTSSNKKIYLIGDSIMWSLLFNLKDRVVKKNYQFVTSTPGACLFYPGFNLVSKKIQKISELCNDKYFQKLKLILSDDINSIIIFGGRFPLDISGYYFDNQEGKIEGDKLERESKYVSVGKYGNIQTSFKNEILELSKNNKIILIYPLPEVGWNVLNKLNNFFLIKKKSKNVNKQKLNINEYITTSYQVYQNRTKSSFELLNSIRGENIYRVYPHTLFCNTIIKNRCVTHDDKNIFYSDSIHPSLKGIEMINKLIIKEIEKIELQSN